MNLHGRIATRNRIFLLACLFIPLLSPAWRSTARADTGVWLDVPFVKQTEEGCGSASLAMLLQYWREHGASVAPGREDAVAIQQKLYSGKGPGIFASAMQRYLQESGFRVFAVAGEWSDLRKHLSQGRPLILSVQPSGKRAPLHYVVASGIDWERQAVFLNDPARGKLIRVERAEFEKEWQAAHNWMLLAVPEASE